MVFDPNAQTVFEDGPAVAPTMPRKSLIRKLLTQYEQIMSAFTTNGGLVFSSKSAMDADLNYPVNRMAWVVGDATPANNGIYRKTGGVGSGVWTKLADLPYSFIVATDSGEGTPNAIKAATPVPVSSSALVLLNVKNTNTGSPVTVSFNGGPPLTVKTNGGNNVAAGGLIADMVLAGRAVGSEFRLVSDQASAAIIAQAEAVLANIDSTVASATAALMDQVEAVRDEAQAAATEAAMYAEMVGAAVYDFNFDTDPSTPGLDWNS
jgi:hypothetical protein